MIDQYNPCLCLYWQWGAALGSHSNTPAAPSPNAGVNGRKMQRNHPLTPTVLGENTKGCVPISPRLAGSSADLTVAKGKIELGNCLYC